MAQSVPTDLTGIATPYIQNTLSWTKDDTEDKVFIERAPDVAGSPGSYAVIGNTNRSDGNGSVDLTAPLGVSPNQYFDDTVAANTTYWYKIRAWSAAEGFSNYTSAVSITSANPAAAPVANAGSDISALLGEVVQFSGESSTGVHSVEWTFGDNQGEYSLARNMLKPAHLYRAAGVYTATLTVTNSLGATNQDTVLVTVTEIPDSTGADLVDMGDSGNPLGASAYIAPGSLTDGSGNRTKFLAAVDYAAARNTTNPQKIIIPQGAVIDLNGDYSLPAPTGSKYITITGNQTYTRNKRVIASQISAMPKIRMTANTGSLNTATTTHHYRFQGIDYTQTDAALTLFWYLRLGNSDVEASQAALSHHFILEHCAFVTPSNRELQHALFIVANDVSVADSWFEGIKHTGSDSQAIIIFSSRIAVINTLLEGSTENLLVGGFEPRVEQAIPDGIVIRRNNIRKPIEWFPGNVNNSNPLYAGTRYSVKNSLELKTGQNIIIHGNYVDRAWSSGQQYMLLFRAGSDSGNAQTNNVWVSSNKLKSMAYPLEVIGYESPPRGSRRILVENNLFWDIDPTKWYDPNAGVFSSPDIFFFHGSFDLLLKHNTFVQRPVNAVRMTVMFDRAVTEPKFTRLAMLDNIHIDPAHPDGYQVWNARTSQAGTAGMSNAADFSPTFDYRGNLYAGGNAGLMPANNFYPTFTSFLSQFINYLGADFRIDPASIYYNAGTDGTSPGVNMATVNAETLHSEDGQWGDLRDLATSRTLASARTLATSRTLATNRTLA